MANTAPDKILDREGGYTPPIFVKGHWYDKHTLFGHTDLTMEKLVMHTDPHTLPHPLAVRFEAIQQAPPKQQHAMTLNLMFDIGRLLQPYGHGHQPAHGQPLRSKKDPLPGLSHDQVEMINGMKSLVMENYHYKYLVDPGFMAYPGKPHHTRDDLEDMSILAGEARARWAMPGAMLDAGIITHAHYRDGTYPFVTPQEATHPSTFKEGGFGRPYATRAMNKHILADLSHASDAQLTKLDSTYPAWRVIYLNALADHSVGYKTYIAGWVNRAGGSHVMEAIFHAISKGDEPTAIAAADHRRPYEDAQQKNANPLLAEFDTIMHHIARNEANGTRIQVSRNGDDSFFKNPDADLTPQQFFAKYEHVLSPENQRNLRANRQEVQPEQSGHGETHATRHPENAPIEASYRPEPQQNAPAQTQASNQSPLGQHSFATDFPKLAGLFSGRSNQSSGQAPAPRIIPAEYTPHSAATYRHTEPARAPTPVPVVAQVDDQPRSPSSQSGFERDKARFKAWLSGANEPSDQAPAPKAISAEYRHTEPSPAATNITYHPEPHPEHSSLALIVQYYVEHGRPHIALEAPGRGVIAKLTINARNEAVSNGIPRTDGTFDAGDAVSPASITWKGIDGEQHSMPLTPEIIASIREQAKQDYNGVNTQYATIAGNHLAPGKSDSLYVQGAQVHVVEGAPSPSIAARFAMNKSENSRS